MSFIKNIIYFYMSVQEKILEKRLSKTFGAKINSKRKKHYSDGCVITLDAMAESEKKRLEDEIDIILKSTNYEPSEMLEYIKKHNTDVFYIDNSNALNSIGENEGFIYPQKGLKALYLSVLTSKTFKFNTDEMFIVPKTKLDKYIFIYHFYNWYAFKHHIEGMDAKSQNLLKKYLFDNSEENIKKLQLSDIYSLKDAIKQDKSAIEFVFKLCQKIDSSQKALEKIKNDGASI